MNYLDLRDNAAACDALLRDCTATCGDCKGEGTVEVAVKEGDHALGNGNLNVGDLIEITCEQCDGEGEFFSTAHCEDPDHLRSLIALAYAATNTRGPDEDPAEWEGVLDSFYVQAENEPTAIPEHDFKSYAQDLAKEIGAIDPDQQWPFSCIDWERAARELQMDYSSFDWEGTTYYTRSY